MLKAPPFKQYPDVTVFQDDTELWRFYLVAGFPRVRRAADGSPVFLLVKYAHSDQAREADPTLKVGGGYLAFDAELSVPPERVAEIEAELQAWVNAEWERLKAMPPSLSRNIRLNAKLDSGPVSGHWKSSSGFTGRTGPALHGDLGSLGPSVDLGRPDAWAPPPDAPPPKVIFGEPLYKSGKVKMDAPQSAALVQSRVAERTASLVGSNVAAFAMELTTEGATFFQKTLLGDDGGGATDLTPISVEYTLTMVARVPPASVRVTFDGAQVYQLIQDLFHEKDSSTRPGVVYDDFFTSESAIQMAITAGVLEVQVDPGGITDPETINLLTTEANKLATELAVGFATTKDRTGPTNMTGDATGDIVGSEAEFYHLKQESDIERKKVEYTTTLKANIDYTISAQGMLQTSFADLSPEQIARCVREIDLDDDFFQTLDLTVRAFANWETDGIQFVEVAVEYGEVTQSFTFDAANRDPQKWSPRLSDRKRTYRFRSRVVFNGRGADESDWSAWKTESRRDLNFSVATPGKIAVEVIPAGLDFTQVLDAVIVSLTYADPARGVEPVGTSVVLTADRLSGKWERLIYAPWDKPVSYRHQYLLKTGTWYDTGFTPTDGVSPVVVVPRPPVDILDVAVVPVVDWAAVKLCAVSLGYTDADDPAYQPDAQAQIKGPDTFFKWSVLLKDPSRRRFRYKALATFADGTASESPWKDATGDQTLLIPIETPPRLAVQVLPLGVNFAETPTVKVNLTYQDPGGVGTVTQTVVLSKRDEIGEWSLNLRKGAHKSYTWQISYFRADGQEVKLPPQSGSDNRLIVPALRIPRVGAKVSPVMVNWEVTPAIEVHLTYSDPSRGVSEAKTFTFAKGDPPQEWFVLVQADAPRTFSIEVTYYTPDGAPHVAPRVQTTRESFLVPPYKPE